MRLVRVSAKILATTLCALLFAACSIVKTPEPFTVASNPEWKASTHKDEFTDKITKMVTLEEFYDSGFLYSRGIHYFPFIAKKDGILYAGVRSGKRIRFPTGTVQLRIDSNKAFTITPDETPANLVPGTSDKNNKVQEKYMTLMAKSMSPYTAATGAKAKTIIKEMLSGKVLKYRTVGLNQAASSTGEVGLDRSFREALKEIGITSESLNSTSDSSGHPTTVQTEGSNKKSSAKEKP